MAIRVDGMVLDGIEGVPVILEARTSETQRPGEIKVVGLPDAAVKEGMHRARSGIWGVVGPAARSLSQGILINLSPADLRKTGRSLDLPLAMVYAAVLLGLEGPGAAGPAFLGEVGLGGAVRPVAGVLAAVLAARAGGRSGLVLPAGNLDEARLVAGPELYPVNTVEEALEVVRGAGRRDDGPRGAPRGIAPEAPDLSDVRGQHQARRALEVAAAGGHNLLMEGPPGSGKTMLARRLPGLLPRLEDDQALESARVHSAVRTLDPARIHEPPFRAPHHTATPAGLAGGGSPIRPGEFSLAHNGVLFLDELPEFDRRALEVLREPLEERRVHITRAGSVRSFPAGFLCVAAMNPCPCGYGGLGDGRCTCTPHRVARYRGRLSGPLLDRFDLRVFLRPVPAEELLAEGGGEPSAPVRGRVTRARERQRRRFGRPNAAVPDRAMRRAAEYGPEERRLLLKLVTAHRLTARAARRLERVARTVADLEGSRAVGTLHLMEALGFRLGHELEGLAESVETGSIEDVPGRG